jgi:prepilin-type N-terminal cleavage/methylation domain-containing protein
VNVHRPNRLNPRAGDRGFGLIEVLVSMFLLGVIAVAIIPVLVQGLRLSATNAGLAAATQLANQQIEQVRGATSCAAITPATVTATTQGIPLRAARTVGTTCPSASSGYPTTVKVSVSVTRTDTSAVLASASTLVFVTGP